MNRSVVPILAWLWENVTEPVLRALGLDGPVTPEPPKRRSGQVRRFWMTRSAIFRVAAQGSCCQGPVSGLSWVAAVM
jgi:hypothetical protein